MWACIENHCTILDIGYKGSGPRYTFYAENIEMTYMYHFIANESLPDQSIKCDSQDELVINTSDHFIINGLVKY